MSARSINNRQTVRGALEDAARILGDAGIDGARREAQLLVGHALGIGREVVLGEPGRRLANGERRRLDDLVGRRAGHEPAAYITGLREFWSLPFAVTRDTLIPRPDSETVVEAALAAIAGRTGQTSRAGPLRLLDFGTGTGCLLLALLSELPDATGLGVDIAVRALSVARTNARRLGLAGRASFVAADWGRGIGGAFDLIVANPPYIGDGEAGGLAPEIRDFEPSVALFCGADPLACHRALGPHMARLLGHGGAAVLEIGAGQADDVAAIMADVGLGEAGRWRDLAGIERCIVLRHAAD